MPLFFWTCAMWKTPIDLGVRLFKNSDNDTVTHLPITASSQDLDKLGGDPAFDTSSWKRASTLPSEGPLYKSLQRLRRKRESLSLSMLSNIIGYHSQEQPVPLSCAAAHPTLRLLAEFACTLHIPGASTSLHVLAHDDGFVSSTSTGNFRARSIRTPRPGQATSLLSYTREVSGHSPWLLAYYSAIAQWWWARPLPNMPEDSAIPSLSFVLTAITNNGGRTPTSTAWANGRDLQALQRSLCELQAASSPEKERLRVCAIRLEAGSPILTSVASLGARSCRHVTHVTLAHCRGVRAVGSLGQLPALEELDVSYSGVTTLTGLAISRCLRRLVARGCHELRSISELGQIDTLQEIIASNSGVEDIEGLAASSGLLFVSFYGCSRLKDLGPLGYARALQEVYASESGVEEIDGLRHSRTLARVGLRYCDVFSVTPLTHIPTLEVLNISCTPVRSLEGLERCTALTHVDVSGCQRLGTLAVLRAATSLKELDASLTRVSNVAGVAGAPNLTRLVLKDCGELQDVYGLHACASLSELLLSNSNVSSLEGLSECHHLRTVHVEYCKRLTPGKLDVLLGLPCLEVVALRGCPGATGAVVDSMRTRGISACVK